MARRKKRDPIAAIFTPKHPYLPGTEILRQIDVDLLAEQLDVDAQGARDGADAIPPPDGRTLALKEREIVGRLRELWDENVEGVRRAYEGYRSRIASYTGDADLDSLTAEPAAVAVKLREAAREERSLLVEEYKAVKLARDDLEDFRRRERISHAPRHNQHILVKLAMLGGAAVLEIGVNAAIFAGADAGGILGAVLKVAVIPVANIGGNWLWTHWLTRNVLMRHWMRRAVGVFGALLTAFWLIYLNLAVAHWREGAEAALSMEAATTAVGRAFSDPFGLQSFEAWGLFLIGCFAGAVAIYEGWAWKDPFPGYTRRAELADRLLADWHHNRQDAMARLEEIRSENTERLADAQRRAGLAVSERPDIAGKAAGLSEDVRLYADHLRYVCEELGARYREANLRARTVERPTQFDAPLTLSLELPALPPLVVGESPVVAGRLSEAIRQITEAYAEACSRVPGVEDLEAAGGAA